eukprot:CAMPEP_0198113608 /NCGR_PEP_ID=MMETSP1442-20131203/5227_1 /TAXON_ID= /ORGANISM="Craspedostauros australis, Strain CCMP3328" /LENGTH=120 /DNA_ID=CAMNT_0043770741 /DNA_START=123 /DNA_END=485 /DNA_ORIENTATION=-
MTVIECKTEDAYYDAMSTAGNRLVVVDCFAPWCPPCQQIAPFFEMLSNEYDSSSYLFIKVDVDAAPSLGKVLSVWAMPTFVFFRNGERKGSFMGANTNMLRRGLDNDGNVGLCGGMCAIQ